MATDANTFIEWLNSLPTEERAKLHDGKRLVSEATSRDLRPSTIVIVLMKELRVSLDEAESILFASPEWSSIASASKKATNDLIQSFPESRPEAER